MATARAPFAIEADAQILAGKGDDDAGSSVDHDMIATLVVDAIAFANVSGTHSALSAAVEKRGDTWVGARRTVSGYWSQVRPSSSRPAVFFRTRRMSTSG